MFTSGSDDHTRRELAHDPAACGKCRAISVNCLTQLLLTERRAGRGARPVSPKVLGEAAG